MALLEWSDKYSVNIKEMDEQHKKLFNMINELHDAMKGGRGKEALGGIFTGLIQYVGTHFAAEERLMSAHAYAGYVAQKAEHDKLIKRALELQKNFQEGAPVVTVEVMNFLKDWLQTHILGSDKKYGPFLNGKGVI